MTVIFSSISPKSDLITITVDSAVTISTDDTGQTEYSKGQKIYCYEGIGCVATWGSRDHNKFDLEFLSKQNLSPQTHSIHDLANLVYEYLTKIYQPDVLGLDDVGYHVAGFDAGKPVLYHIWWGTHRPVSEGETQEYHYAPGNSTPLLLVYNGRNDLAVHVINALLREVDARKEVNYDLNRHISLIQFGDFVARFASEITPEVGPPFHTVLISPQNRTSRIINRHSKPIDPEMIVQGLVKIGFNVTGDIMTPHEKVVRSLPITLRQILDNLSFPMIKSAEVLIAKSSVIERFPTLYLNGTEPIYPDLLLCMPGGKCSLGNNDFWYGPPDLVIEVMSSETELSDRGYKFERYRDAIVREYWMINPEEYFIEVWRFENGLPTRTGIFGIGDEEFSSIVLGCTIPQHYIEAIIGWRTLSK